MCRVLKVSPSGYQAWQHRALSAPSLANVVLTQAIRLAAMRQSVGVDE
jgi:hypothetical protein